MAKKKILFIHQNFPGQYKSLAPFLSNKKKYEIHSLSVSNSDPAETEERLSNFKDILSRAVSDDNLRGELVENAYENVQQHSYDERIKTLLNRVEDLFN